MEILLLLVLILFVINLFVTYLLFHNRLISKIIIAIQLIVFIINQTFIWKYFKETLFDSFSLLSFIIFIIVISFYIFTIIFLSERIITRNFINNLIKNYIPVSNIDDKDRILAKSKYLFASKNKEVKILYHNIFDINKQDKYIDYLCVFYVLKKEKFFKRVYVYKYIFRENNYKHLDTCPNCGAKNNDDLIYCNYCNTKLINEDNELSLKSTDLIETLSLIEAYTKSKKDNIYWQLVILNILFIPYLFLILRLLDNLTMSNFMISLFYIILITIPYFLISIFDIRLYKPVTTELSKYALYLILISMVMAFDIVMNELAIKYFLPIMILVKIVTLIYDYIVYKQNNKKDV